jgi:O-antigen/teichoic acid export membrane protein
MATLTNKIATNTLYQIIARGLSTILGLAALAILTRYLGISGYGAFTTVTAFLQFFGILVDFGLTLTATQMISEPEADEGRIMGNIFALRALSGVVFFGLAPVVALFLPYPTEVKIGIAVGGLAYLAMTQQNALLGIFQKYLKMGRAAIAEVIGRVVLVGGITVVAAANWGLVGAIIALAVANVAQLATLLGFAQRISPFRLRFERAFIRHIIGRSWPIGLSIAFNLLYLKGDIVLLSLFRSQAEVGLYGAAYKVLDVITVIPMMFMGLVLPILVHAWNTGDHEAFKRRMQKAFDFSALIALPLVGGAFVVGRNLMMFVAGTDFRSSGDLLAILIIASLALFFSGLYGHTIVAIGKQRRAIWAYGANAALALVAYLIFIPRFGALAAAWITVGSEVVIATLLFILTYRFTRVLPTLTTTVKAIFATILMSLVLLALPTWHVLVLVIIGAGVYVLFLFLLRAVSRQTLRELLPTNKV